MLSPNRDSRLRSFPHNRTTLRHLENSPPLEVVRAARRVAMRELSRAPACDCCPSLQHHLHKLLGSTLFFDDDPVRLHAAFSPLDRRLIGVRILASCIVLHGRPREELFALPRLRTFAAFELLLHKPAPC